MLVEHLASHGYLVISLQHKDQLAEFRALQRVQNKDEKQVQVKLEREIKAATGEKRAALSKEYFGIASNTNRIVSARSVDIEFVIKELEALLDAVPGIVGVSSMEIVGVLGLSLGGAVATEYSKRNGDSASCVVNMDGGIYGVQLEKPIDKRYLMLYSQQNSGINDQSLAMTDGTEVTRRVIPDTRHLNFHDIAAIYPMLKWLGVIGSANPMAVVEQRNKLISDFVSRERPRL
jgi:pimeloyl-ACP methyl ester carboxylesterase